MECAKDYNVELPTAARRRTRSGEGVKVEVMNEHLLKTSTLRRCRCLQVQTCSRISRQLAHGTRNMTFYKLQTDMDACFTDQVREHGGKVAGWGSLCLCRFRVLVIPYARRRTETIQTLDAAAFRDIEASDIELANTNCQNRCVASRVFVGVFCDPQLRPWLA